MKIVVLDGHTANPGDLSWAPLEAFGELTVYPRTAPEEVVKRAKDAEVVLTNKVNISEEIMAQLPQLNILVCWLRDTMWLMWKPHAGAVSLLPTFLLIAPTAWHS